ncbi:MAG TPA: hydroxymethylglutaryl-CoA lyase [Candidatus Binatia bacterium]|nr:hydroxymethylglutaryl-CoA lyase [Candidatus Binatia bacterium]
MTPSEHATIIECPRDAWQGLPQQIPTEAKVDYLRALVEAGFRHIDAVSFVSPKHVPQMADSEEVLRGLAGALGQMAGRPEIIGIVVNQQGLERALAASGVTTIGYPYSISAYFRRANANMSREESRQLVETLQQNATRAGRNLVVYISMAFGNPYEEPWGAEIVADTLAWLAALGVRCVSLADTVGTASPKAVGELYRAVRGVAPGVELGVHLHSRREAAAEKILAAWEAGCRRFDSALGGLGGCPFAGDELVGNIPTEIVLETLAARGVNAGLQPSCLGPVLELSERIRLMYSGAGAGKVN